MIETTASSAFPFLRCSVVWQQRVYEGRVTARLPWSCVCHYHEPRGVAVPDQKSSAFLPQSAPQGQPSAPTADAAMHDSYKPLVSFASDWKSNSAGSWLQFKTKVISNWPSDYLPQLRSRGCGAASVGSKHWWYPAPKARSPERALTWALGKERRGLCNNTLEDREEKNQELVNRQIQLSFEL